MKKALYALLLIQYFQAITCNSRALMPKSTDFLDSCTGMMQKPCQNNSNISVA